MAINLLLCFRRSFILFCLTFYELKGYVECLWPHKVKPKRTMDEKQILRIGECGKRFCESPRRDAELYYAFAFAENVREGEDIFRLVIF